MNYIEEDHVDVEKGLKVFPQNRANLWESNVTGLSQRVCCLEYGSKRIADLIIELEMCLLLNQFNVILKNCHISYADGEVEWLSSYCCIEELESKGFTILDWILYLSSVGRSLLKPFHLLWTCMVVKILLWNKWTILLLRRSLYWPKIYDSVANLPYVVPFLHSVVC